MFSLRLAGVSFALMFAIACGSNYSAPPTTPSPTPDPAPPGATTSAVTIQAGAAALGNRAYAPPELNVTVGTVVTWTNSDSAAHTSTSDAPGWNSGIIPPRGTFSVTLNNAGTFLYHCSIHPGMVGRITVR